MKDMGNKYQPSEARLIALENIEKGLSDIPFPKQLVIETTSRCNMKCLHCSHKEMKRPRAHMAESLFKRIVEEIALESPDCEIWPTFYGEALLLGDTLWKWLKYAEEVGCNNIVLNSNGSLLGRKGVIDQVLSSPLKRFILSLDGFTKETFEKIRVGGKRDKIYAAVEELLRRKEELGLMYPVIQCQFSVMEENETEVEQFKEFWMARKAEIKIRQKLTWTSTGTIKARELNLGNEFRIPCPWGVNSTAIHQDGNLVACPVDYEGRFIAGNVEKLSIKEIWQTSHRAGLRERHLRHDWENVPEVCKGCPDWQVVGAKYVSEEDKQALDWSRPFWHHDQ